MTFLKRCADNLPDGGTGEVVAVASSESMEELPAGLARGAREINRDPTRGMVSTLPEGMKPVEKRAFFIYPIDHPLVKPCMIQAVPYSSLENEEIMTVPKCLWRTGRPPVFPSWAGEKVLFGRKYRVAGWILDALPGRVPEFQAGDSGAITDIDTVDDYVEEPVALASTESNSGTMEGIKNTRAERTLIGSSEKTGAGWPVFRDPGMIVSSAALPRKSPAPGRDEKKGAVAGHLCRHTGYERMMGAVFVSSGRVMADED